MFILSTVIAGATLGGTIGGAIATITGTSVATGPAVGTQNDDRRSRDLPGRPGARQRPPLTRKGGFPHEPAAHDPTVRPLPPHLPL